MKRYLWSLPRCLSDEILHRFCTVTMLSRDLAALCLSPTPLVALSKMMMMMQRLCTEGQSEPARGLKIMSSLEMKMGIYSRLIILGYVWRSVPSTSLAPRYPKVCTLAPRLEGHPEHTYARRSFGITHMTSAQCGAQCLCHVQERERELLS